MLAGQAADGLSALIGTERVQKGDSSTREGGVEREGGKECLCECASVRACVCPGRLVQRDGDRAEMNYLLRSRKVQISGVEASSSPQLFIVIHLCRVGTRATVFRDKRGRFRSLIVATLPLVKVFGFCHSNTTLVCIHMYFF